MEYWIWLTTVPYIGPVTSNRLLNIFGDPKAVYCADVEDFYKIKGITQRQVQNILLHKSLDTAHRILEDCRKYNICYPSEHKKLMERVGEKGLLLSEYPPGTKPAKFRFPQRNRLISGWSNKLLVVAPGKNSGAFITADYEKTYGRDVEIVSF